MSVLIKASTEFAAEKMREFDMKPDPTMEAMLAMAYVHGYCAAIKDTVTDRRDAKLFQQEAA